MGIWCIVMIPLVDITTTKKYNKKIPLQDFIKKWSQKYTFCIILQKTGEHGYLDVSGVLDASRHQRYRKKKFKIFSVGSVH